MTRQDFLNELRLALQGEVTTAVLNDNLSYYENFILEESRKGKTEEEVLEELGSPRLIAKTIIDTSQNVSQGENYEDFRENDAADDGVNININGKSYHQNRRKIRVTAWILIAAVIVIIVALLALVGSVISFLAPVLVPVLLVLILVGVLSGKK